MILTGPPFLVLGEVLAGVCAAINHRRYNNQINQTRCSRAQKKKYRIDVEETGGRTKRRGDAANHESERSFNLRAEALSCRYRGARAHQK